MQEQEADIGAGEEAADMLARFETGVIAEHPHLVLWQVGTNSVLRDGWNPPRADRRSRR